MGRTAYLAHVATLVLALAAGPLLGADAQEDTYDEESVLQAATNFFGESTQGLAKVVERAFKDHGRPNGYIAGEELSGAIAFGLRYGDGTLQTRSGATKKVFWTGPSIGFDVGGNASKVFILVYHLDDVGRLFQRFPAVDGSLYYVAGVGVNYQQSEDVVLAPIRLGVGLRAGASLGYMHYTRKRSWLPF